MNDDNEDGSDSRRVVLISGGTSGIGAGLVKAFLEVGDLVYTFGRNPDKVGKLAGRWKEQVAAGRLVARPGDATDYGFIACMAAALRDGPGRLDVLVNNAGVILSAGDVAESVEAWRATLETNLIAPFALTQACVGLLGHSEHPVVINLSSACAQHPFASCTSTSYSVSKAGLDMLTRRLALGLAPRGIRVNAVAPGVVASEMWGDFEDLMKETVERRHVLKRQIVTPDDVANAVVFLASPKARLVTGATLNVDAGYALG